MAASPMTRLPCISTLFTINLDGNFRACDGAQSATGAVSILMEGNGTITLGIIVLGRDDVALLAGIDAEVALFASFKVYLDQAFQFAMIPYNKRLMGCASLAI